MYHSVTLNPSSALTLTQRAKGCHCVRTHTYPESGIFRPGGPFLFICREIKSLSLSQYSPKCSFLLSPPFHSFFSIPQPTKDKTNRRRRALRMNTEREGDRKGRKADRLMRVKNNQYITSSIEPRKQIVQNQKPSLHNLHNQIQDNSYSSPTHWGHGHCTVAFSVFYFLFFVF